MNDSYQEGFRGQQHTGSGAEGFEYSRGRQDRERRDNAPGAGMLVAAVLFSPVICAAYPIAGLATLGTGFLVSRGGPFVGIKSGSGVLILVTLVAILAAFFFGLAMERRASVSKTYRAVRWIPRMLLVPGILVSMMISSGSEGVSAGRLLVMVIFIPLCWWLLKGLDRFVGATGVNQD